MNPVPSKLRPVAPAPRETVYNAIAAYAMREERRRLAGWSIVGVEAALVVGIFAPGAWLLAIPLVCVGSIGAWGLAAQMIRTLDAAHERAPVRRSLLTFAKSTAVVIGTISAIAGFYGVLLLILGPSWTL